MNVIEIQGSINRSFSLVYIFKDKLLQGQGPGKNCLDFSLIRRAKNRHYQV